MPMNEQPPWGKKKQPGGPEDLLAALIQKIRDAFAGREKEPPQGPAGEPPPERATGPFSGPGKVVAIVAAFIVLQAAAGAFYTIKPGEVPAADFVLVDDRPIAAVPLSRGERAP